MSKITQL